MENTSLSTTGAEKDLGLYLTRLPVKVKSMPTAADKLKSNTLLSPLACCGSMGLTKVRAWAVDVGTFFSSSSIANLDTRPDSQASVFSSLYFQAHRSGLPGGGKERKAEEKEE